MGPAEFNVLATANEQAPHATLAYILHHDRRRLATCLLVTDSIPLEGPRFFPLVQP